jgi:hypothetical protein
VAKAENGLREDEGGKLTNSRTGVAGGMQNWLRIRMAARQPSVPVSFSIRDIETSVLSVHRFAANLAIQYEIGRAQNCVARTAIKARRR